MWLLSLLKMLWKGKTTECSTWEKKKTNSSAAFSLMSLNLTCIVKWCTKLCPVNSQALGVWKGRSPHCLYFCTKFMAFQCQQWKNKPPESHLQIHTGEWWHSFAKSFCIKSPTSNKRNTEVTWVYQIKLVKGLSLFNFLIYSEDEDDIFKQI